MSHRGFGGVAPGGPPRTQRPMGRGGPRDGPRDSRDHQRGQFERRRDSAVNTASKTLSGSEASGPLSQFISRACSQSHVSPARDRSRAATPGTGRQAQGQFDQTDSSVEARQEERYQNVQMEINSLEERRQTLLQQQRDMDYVPATPPHGGQHMPSPHGQHHPMPEQRSRDAALTRAWGAAACGAGG